MEQEVLDAPITSEVEIYNPIAAGIALMLEKHGHVLTTPPVVANDAKAMTLAKAGRTELVKFRTTLEKARKEEKAESLAYGRLVDSEAARIQAFATPLEVAYDTAITTEENRLEAIRQAELEVERQRITGHRARIQAIKEVRETANMCRTADRLKQLIDGMPAQLELPFEEFQGEAEAVFNEVCDVLKQLHNAKVEAEAAAVELARQQAELVAQRAAQEESERAAAAASAEEEAQAKARRDAEEAELQAKREAFEREQTEARAIHQVEVERLAAQQREIDDQKRQQEDQFIAAVVQAQAPQAVDDVVDAEVKPDEPLVLSDAPRVIVPLMTSHASPPTLRLGQINERLAPIQLTADGLRTLGFEPAGRERAAMLYHEQDFDAICLAVGKHVYEVRIKQAA